MEGSTRIESKLKASDTRAVEQEMMHPTDSAAWNESIDFTPDNSRCSNDSGISDMKSIPSCNVQNLQHRNQCNIDIANLLSNSSSESESCTDSSTSDDNSEDSESSWLYSGSAAKSRNINHSSLDYVQLGNAEKRLSKFEGFISNKWPEGRGGELEVLQAQLTHGGDFSTDMKVIDLSTPACVGMDTTKVLSLLENKILNGKDTLEHIGTLVLPNVRELASGDEVKVMIEDYCRILCCRGKKVQLEEVIIKCDEVSGKFVPGDLSWIEGFRSYNNVGTIAVSSLLVNVCLYLQFAFRYFVLREIRTGNLKSFAPNFVAA